MKENSIKEDIERLKLCSTNKCYICGRYEKEECMLERNRCEQHILSDYKRVLEMNEVLLKENEELKNIELKSKGGAIKVSLEGALSLENKIKQLEKEKKELELEIKNRKFSHMNLYNEYKYYKQFKSLSIETIKNKIEYLDKQQADGIEDRELKVSDSEIIFARDTLEKLLEDNYEKF